MPDLTMFCPFTRAWAVEPFFEALGKSDLPSARFVAYVDSTDEKLAQKVKRAGVEVHLSGRDATPDTAGPYRRRVGHARMREASKALVGDGPLLLLEDDTLVPPLTYGPLAETLGGCDWAVGAEVGRWTGGQMPGVWRIETHEGRLVRKVAVMPEGESALIDASGFYCVMTTGRLYRSMDFATWNDKIGHDVHTTYRLTQAGYRLMVDWRVQCVHMTPRERLTMAEARPFAASLLGCERLPLRRT